LDILRNKEAWSLYHKFFDVLLIDGVGPFKFWGMVLRIKHKVLGMLSLCYNPGLAELHPPALATVKVQESMEYHRVKSTLILDCILGFIYEIAFVQLQLLCFLLNI
jgi:hypothetical protein